MSPRPRRMWRPPFSNRPHPTRASPGLPSTGARPTGTAPTAGRLSVMGSFTAGCAGGGYDGLAQTGGSSIRGRGGGHVRHDGLRDCQLEPIVGTGLVRLPRMRDYRPHAVHETIEGYRVFRQPFAPGTLPSLGGARRDGVRILPRVRIRPERRRQALRGVRQEAAIS